MDEDALQRIAEMPKLELHLHIEGGAPPAFIRGLAQEKRIDLSGVFRPDGSYAFRDFMHFLSVYEVATSVLTSPEDYARLVTAVLEESAANGVVYSETFLSPDFCGGGDVAAWREYLHAMIEAADAAERAHGITLRGIVTCIRHFGPEQAKTAALCAAETAGDWLVGFFGSNVPALFSIVEIGLIDFERVRIGDDRILGAVVGRAVEAVIPQRLDQLQLAKHRNPVPSCCLEPALQSQSRRQRVFVEAALLHMLQAIAGIDVPAALRNPVRK